MNAMFLVQTIFYDDTQRKQVVYQNINLQLAQLGDTPTETHLP